MAVTFHLVRKHARVPLLDGEAVEQCGVSTERDEINMSGGDTCNAATSGRHISSKRATTARAQQCYPDNKCQESGLSADTGCF